MDALFSCILYLVLILSLFTFVSGLLTILAPCIWPLLPIILSSSTQGGKRRPLGITLGIALSFAIFTLTISYLVRIFPLDVDSFRLIAVIVIGLMGLTFVIPQLTKLMEGWVSTLVGKFGPKFSNQSSGFGGGLITGLSLGIVWSPCAGPILASIATLAATRSVNAQVVLLTLIYVAGVGIPLFLFATLGQKLFTKTKFLSANLGRIQQIFGVIMLLTALAIYTGYDRTLQARLLDAFPSYSSFLNKFESNDQVLEQLDKLQDDMNDEEPSINLEDMNILFTDKASDSIVLPNLGPAPEFIGITNWINSNPLTMAELKGKVVLIDFWTYTCINCIRTLPHLKSWHAKYADDGLVIVGVHAPEFEFEKSLENVTKAMSDYGLTYPVAQDNDFRTWRAYGNRYWPAKYLIDINGNVRYYHFGEGAYEETEKYIRQLLGDITEVSEEIGEMQDETPTGARTPELYLGTMRMEYLSNGSTLDGEQSFSSSSNPPSDYFHFVGDWNLQGEYSESTQDSELILNFRGKNVYLVITPSKAGEEIEVYLDNELISEEASGADVLNGKVILDENRLYELVDFKDAKNSGVLKLKFKSPGIKIFAFTFG